MVYLFEDNQDVPMSHLFLTKYCSVLKSNSIQFVGGNRKFERNIAQQLKNGQSVCVYIDVIFDNINTIRKYNRLVDRYKNDAVAIIPVMCMEYYMVLYASRFSGLILDSTSITRCINIDKGYRKFCMEMGFEVKSFESFCKNVLERSFLPCLKQKVNKYAPDSDIRRLFYIVDCRNCQNTDCKYNMSLVEKSEGLVTSYNIFPEIPGFNPVSRKELEHYILSYLSLLSTKTERGSEEWSTLQRLMKKNLVGQKWIWKEPSQDI